MSNLEEILIKRMKNRERLKKKLSIYLMVSTN